MGNNRDERIVQLFDEGKTAKQIQDEIGVGLSTVCKVLKLNGRKRRTVISAFSEDEINNIKSLYINGDVDTILTLYPSLSRKYLYSWMHTSGVPCGNFYWTDADIQTLKENYKLSSKALYNLFDGRFSECAIKTKVQKLGLIKRYFWTEEEDSIIKKYYSYKPVDDIVDMIPNHTRKAIVTRAKLLGVTQLIRLNERYSKEQIQFIEDHYDNMTDFEMATALGKPVSGIREQRAKLGHYRINKDYSGYENIIKLFRGHIQAWKDASMKNCAYKCVLSGSKNFNVHHLYGFNMIVQETFETLAKKGLLHGDKLEHYTQSELEYMISVFNVIHSKYPLGVCVRCDIHNLFHSIYGIGSNTEQQWNKFVNDYRDGKYSNVINV